MSSKSPAKILRSAIRITRFLERKPVLKYHENLPQPKQLSLSTEILPEIDIPPSLKFLSFSNPTNVSVSPTSRNLAFCKQLPKEIVPGITNDDEDLFFTYINGGTFQTSFVCWFCYSDNFNSTQSIRRHVRNAHRPQIEQICQTQLPYQPKFQDLN